ncbi:Nephrocystin-3 [Orbilia brochopaga]|nr:Nephrocystin-3 [Drechslerella brochopaga]
MGELVKLSRQEYTVGWLCALQKNELVAARAMLDVRHEPCDLPFHDENSYTYGSINNHNVVIACMPSGIPGTLSALKLVQPLSQSFPNMRIHLFVGIGGGIPRNPPPSNPLHDIHLGDVVIGWNERPGAPSVVQYDFRRAEVGQDELLGTLDKPDRRLLNALTTLVAKYHEGETKFSEHLKRSKFLHPGLENDKLYQSVYPHGGGDTCSMCDPYLSNRPKRKTSDFVFHQGTILSGDSVIKDAELRDRLAKKFSNAICVEMEAAGVMDEKHCLVIRGICDYADSHKNKMWQPYAAATAAAFARELLYTIHLTETRLEGTKNEFSIPVSVPNQRNLSFIGREEVFRKILKAFWSASSANERPIHRLGRRVVALRGLGGSGKTQVALEYAYRYTKEYSAIFWVNASNTTELAKSARKAIESIVNKGTKNTDNDAKDQLSKTYLRIAHSLGLDVAGIASEETLINAVNDASPVECLCNWLRQDSNDSWLIIADNYDEPEACDLETLLPIKDTGHVLITSRARKPYRGCIEIEMSDGIEEQEGVELLSKISGMNILAEERQSVLDIVKSVGGLPLALEHIGAYLFTHPIPFRVYAESLDEELEGPLEKLNAIWEISFRKLSSEAKHMIQLFSLMGNEDIPYRFIEAGKSVVDWMQRDKKAVFKAVGDLLSLSFIGQRLDNSYYLHALVHRWVRDRIGDAIVKDSLIVVNIITSTFTFGDERTASQSAYQYRIMPHIDCCCEIFFSHLAPGDGRLNDQSKRVGYDLARMYTNLGNILKATTVYERSLKGIAGKYSSFDSEVMDAFGTNLRLEGKYEEALKWCTQALDVIRSHDGEGSPKFLTFSSHIAAIYRVKAEYAKAVTRYRWILDQQEKRLGPSDSSILETRQLLAGTLKDSEEYEEALKLLEQVQTEKKKRLGRDHPSTLEALDTIGEILEEQGTFSKALEHHKFAYECQRKSLGDSHYSTLGSKSSIARLYERLGRYEEALICHREVLKQLGEVFGMDADHPWIFMTFSGEADALMRLEKYHEAEEEYRRAYAGFRRLSMKIDELATATNIARSLRDQGQYKAASQWCDRAREGLETELGKYNGFTLVAKICAASIHERQEDYEKALELYEEVLQGYEKRHGTTDHAEAYKTELSMGEILLKQGQYQRAIEYLSRAERGLEISSGETHHHTIEASKLRKEAEALQHKDVEKAPRNKGKRIPGKDKSKGNPDEPAKRRSRWNCFK